MQRAKVSDSISDISAAIFCQEQALFMRLNWERVSQTWVAAKVQ